MNVLSPDLWSKQLRVAPAAVLIREQRRRWGSADAKGTLGLNWRIIQAPRRLVDYVVAHELADLRHRNHSREFWTLLGHAMRDYERRREGLRLLAPTLL